MKVDFVIAAANVIDVGLIDVVLKRLPNCSHINKKYILFDGPKKPDSSYEMYKDTIKNDYPEFIIKTFDNNIYFKEMMKSICSESEADVLFVIQDDVLLHIRDLDEEIDNMRYLPFCNIISYPHKRIKPEGTHWFEPHLDLGDYQASHGWSERTFLCKREELLKAIEQTENDSKSIKTKKFIDTIYHVKRQSKKWEKMDEAAKTDYWVNWGCYISNNILHSHLVAKRP